MYIHHLAVRHWHECSQKADLWGGNPLRVRKNEVEFCGSVKCRFVSYSLCRWGCMSEFRFISVYSC